MYSILLLIRLYLPPLNTMITKSPFFTFLCILCSGLGAYLMQHRNSDYTYECGQFAENNHEKFDPNLARLNTIPKTISYIDSVFESDPKEKSFDSFNYIQVAKKVVKNKFYHGNASYDWRENWIIFLLGKYVWGHFNSIVSPDEVIAHCSAMCSQQTMVFTKIMHTKGFHYRYVYILDTMSTKGHFASEIWLNDQWHYVDVNAEPNWSKLKGKPNVSMEKLQHGNKLSKIYDSSYINIQNLVNKETKILYSNIDQEVGMKMIWFQKVSKFLSWFGLLLLGVTGILNSVYQSNNSKMDVV